MGGSRLGDIYVLPFPLPRPPKPRVDSGPHARQSVHPPWIGRASESVTAPGRGMPTRQGWVDGWMGEVDGGASPIRAAQRGIPSPFHPAHSPMARPVGARSSINGCLPCGARRSTA